MVSVKGNRFFTLRMITFVITQTQSTFKIPLYNFTYKNKSDFAQMINQKLEMGSLFFWIGSGNLLGNGY